MKLELLPNELLLDIFEYFDAIQLLRAFYGLNSRLNNLIETSVESFYLDFRLISKFDFEIIYQQYHRSIDNKVISIAIADDDETPNLPERFFSHNFAVLDFLHLQSLSLYSIQSLDFIFHYHNLPSLTHLKFIQCSLNDAMINVIWSIPTLIDLLIDENPSKGICFTQITETSSSITDLSIKNMDCDLSYLSNIFQGTPYLQRLCITITSPNKKEKLLITIPLLLKLTLSFSGSIETLRSLFEQMNNLRYLNLHISQLLIDGNEWEEMLMNCLPNLKRFRLKMDFKFPSCDYLEDKVDELLETFCTDFWHQKHQWFVRCHWNPNDPFHQAILYTLPYPFDHFHFTDESYSKSTCSNQGKFWSYTHVQILQYEGNNVSNNLIYFPIQFPNLSHLEIIIPVNQSFFSNIPTLNHLISLDVTLLQGDSVYHQLQILLNRAPRLYLLRFSHLSDLELVLFQLTNKSIRRLDFFTKESMLYSWYFNREQCLALAHSSLGQQCRTLVIDIKNRTNIIDLISHMSHLQSLTFHCKDDKWNNNNKTSNDELIQWLHEHLPSNCTISRQINTPSILQIWIR